MGELAGRTAVVTAASSGLGHATAGALAAAGARVFIGGRDAERVAKAAVDVGAAGSAVAELGDPAGTEAFADAAGLVRDVDRLETVFGCGLLHDIRGRALERGELPIQPAHGDVGGIDGAHSTRRTVRVVHP